MYVCLCNKDHVLWPINKYWITVFINSAFKIWLKKAIFVQNNIVIFAFLQIIHTGIFGSKD